MVDPIHGIRPARNGLRLQCLETAVRYHTGHGVGVERSDIHPREHHGLRSCVCARARKRSVDAERALPAQRPVSGKRVGYGDQLAGQLYHRVDLLAADGRAHTILDVRTV